MPPATGAATHPAASLSPQIRKKWRGSARKSCLSFPSTLAGARTWGVPAGGPGASALEEVSGDASSPSLPGRLLPGPGAAPLPSGLTRPPPCSSGGNLSFPYSPGLTYNSIYSPGPHPVGGYQGGVQMKGPEAEGSRSDRQAPAESMYCKELQKHGRRGLGWSEGWGTSLGRGGTGWGPFRAGCCSPPCSGGDAGGWMGLLLLEVTSCFAPQPRSASCGCWRWPVAMPMPCLTTQSLLTPACCWRSRGTWLHRRTRMETREHTRGLVGERESLVGCQGHYEGF